MPLMGEGRIEAEFEVDGVCGKLKMLQWVFLLGKG